MKKKRIILIVVATLFLMGVVALAEEPPKEKDWEGKFDPQKLVKWPHVWSGIVQVITPKKRWVASEFCMIKNTKSENGIHRVGALYRNGILVQHEHLKEGVNGKSREFERIILVNGRYVTDTGSFAKTSMICSRCHWPIPEVKPLPESKPKAGPKKEKKETEPTMEKTGGMTLSSHIPASTFN